MFSVHLTANDKCRRCSTKRKVVGRPKSEGACVWHTRHMHNDRHALKKISRPFPLSLRDLHACKSVSLLRSAAVTAAVHLKVDEESQDLCAIVIPFGKCKCCRLPTGVECAPGAAQEAVMFIFWTLMKHLFGDLFNKRPALMDLVCTVWRRSHSV